LTPDNEEITCFCFAPNGKTLATFSRNLLLRQWNCDTLVCDTTIKGHRMPVLSMDYDQTCSLVATGSTDNVVRVWDIMRGYCTHSFKYHLDIVRFVKFHPDPKQFYLFSSSDDSTLKGYNLVNSTCVADFSSHLSAPTDIAFTDDHEIMVSVGRDKVNSIDVLLV
jgi:U3 small nucleolar RNA-associated protein 13